eukprot:7260128-Pyramimonas_sp.AAC.1
MSSLIHAAQSSNVAPAWYWKSCAHGLTNGTSAGLGAVAIRRRASAEFNSSIPAHCVVVLVSPRADLDDTRQLESLQ